MSYDKFIEIGNTQVGDYTINTIKPNHSNIYETAIKLTELGDWHIVLKYISKEDAIKGHEIYCNMNENEIEEILYKIFKD